MGVVILKGRAGNNLRGDLTVISGGVQGGPVEYIIGDLSVLEGYVTGDQRNSGYIFGALDILEGDIQTRQLEAEIAGELSVLDTEGFVASSNRIALEDELPGLEGSFYGGGVAEGELSLLEGEFTGTVPVIGNIDHTGMLLEGNMYGGAEIDFALNALLAGDMQAIAPTIGRISEESKLSILTGSFDAIVPFGADLTGDLETLAGTLEACTDTSGQIQGSLVTLTGNLHTQTEVAGTLEGDLKTLSGYLHAQHSANGDIEGNLSVLISSLGLTGDEPYDYRILRFIRGETR